MNSKVFHVKIGFVIEIEQSDLFFSALQMQIELPGIVYKLYKIENWEYSIQDIGKITVYGLIIKRNKDH